MKYILNNDNFEVIGKQYLQGVGEYDGTNIGSATDLATVINNNKYVLPKATTDTLGGITAVSSYIGTVITDSSWQNNINNSSKNITSSNGKLYGIHICDENSRNKAFVYIPYATDSTPGIMSIGTGMTTFDNHIIPNLDSKSICFGGENIRQIQLGKDIEWSNTDSVTNMNNYTTAGIYNISGEHTRNDDNLPINNTGGGHTFSGRLSVFDSSLPDTGNDDKDCCLTQLLTLSNRVGGDGNMYIRTGSGSTKDNLTWGKWGKLQTNVEVGVICEGELTKLTDNGMYSGICFNNGNSSIVKYDNAYFVYTGEVQISYHLFNIYKYIYGNTTYKLKNLYIFSHNTEQTGGIIASGHTDSGIASDSESFSDAEYYDSSLFNLSDTFAHFVSPYTTFVLITVNNYAIAGANGVSPNCTQLIYGIDIDGTVIIKKRIGTKDSSTNTWSFDKWGSVSSTNNINVYSTNYTIKPNKFYIWDEVSSLTITFEQGKSNEVNEYMFQFTSGSTPTTLSLPSDIKWVNDELPIIESNYIYQISILNGLGSIMKFKK